MDIFIDHVLQMDIFIVLRPCVILARLLVAVFFQESAGDCTPLLPVHHLIKERIKHWTQTLLFTSSRGSTASGGVTSFANLYLFTAHTNLFCSPFGCWFSPLILNPRLRYIKLFVFLKTNKILQVIILVYLYFMYGRNELAVTCWNRVWSQTVSCPLSVSGACLAIYCDRQESVFSWIGVVFC